MRESGTSFQNTEVESFQKPLKLFQTFVTGNRFSTSQVQNVSVLVKYERTLLKFCRNMPVILYCSPDPTCWSAGAMYQATRIFTSNLKEKMAQRFFNLVLLPRVRDDIAEYKRLNFHLYQALRKALFKPGAFMKGFLLPLCEVTSHFRTVLKAVGT